MVKGESRFELIRSVGFKNSIRTIFKTGGANPPERRDTSASPEQLQYQIANQESLNTQKYKIIENQKILKAKNLLINKMKILD